MEISKKQILFLSKLQKKKYRDLDQKFLLESPKVIWEEFSNPLLDSIYVTESFFAENKDKMLFKNIFMVSNSDMKKISAQINPVGIVALFDIPKTRKFAFKNKNILILDSVQDPGNMGTIIRTADWYGFNSIFLNENCADIYNPKVVGSSMGSIFNINLYRDFDLGILLRDLKKNDYKILASDLNGENFDLKDIGKSALIVGNESKGIGRELLDLADLHFKIAKHGKAESLNVAVATGIIMNELKK